VLLNTAVSHSGGTYSRTVKSPDTVTRRDVGSRTLMHPGWRTLGPRYMAGRLGGVNFQSLGAVLLLVAMGVPSAALLVALGIPSAAYPVERGRAVALA
jgi:hypothetical protein